MADRNLKKMNRKELLELLIQLEQQNESLQARVNELEQLQENRTIAIENAGTLAVAALALSGIFENADRAAEQYLENIKRCSEQQEVIYRRVVSDAERKAKEIFYEAEEERLQRKKAADEYWKALSAKMEMYYLSITREDEQR